MPEIVRGRVDNFYDTRAGERVWVIVWSDGVRRPPFAIGAHLDLQIGSLVRLRADQTLERE